MSQSLVATLLARSEERDFLLTSYSDASALPPADGGDIRLEFDDGSLVEHTILGDIQKANGEPWECCLRTCSRLDNLERKAGLKLMASFEHECWIHDAEERLGDAYAVSTHPRDSAGYRRRIGSTSR